MKNRILIIEDNYYKYFATKQVLESQLRIGIEVLGAKSDEEVEQTIREKMPQSIIATPSGGVADLLALLKKRNVNRRNSEVIMLVTPDYSGARARVA